MAAPCLGSFGAYKYAWSRHVNEQRRQPYDETVWVTKRYIPTDLRVTAPVPRHKVIILKVEASSNSAKTNYLTVVYSLIK